MAESDTILQLGIEAAREGNREEARNLFSLLTRQEPDNAQAWLWLAGVADTPDERRAALERVLELDPSNEMAVKGLQAMGYPPSTSVADAEATAAAAAAAPSRDLTDEERYAAELDAAFGDEYDAVERTAPAPREPLEEGATLGAGAAAVDDDRPRVTPRRTSAYGSRAARPAAAAQDRGGPSTLLLALLAAILLVILLIFLWPRLFGGGGTATNQTAVATAVGGAGTPGSGQPTTGLPGGGVTDTAGITGTTTITTTPGVDSTPTVTDTTSPTTEPPPEATAGPPPDLTQANPQPVSVGTELEAAGVRYSYPNLCAVSCAAVVGNQIGSFTAGGSYVVVLVTTANQTGSAQPIPQNFFVLKDDQGRIHNALPDVSNAYVVRGVNADLSMTDSVPANGLSYSVALVFDVPSGATGLTLFSSQNTAQGWRVLDSVP